MGPVEAEMERELSGPSRPHQERAGISTGLDGFKRRYAGGSWRKVQWLILADGTARTEFYSTGNWGNVSEFTGESVFLSLL